jgi:hypothetical protein
VRAIWSFWSKPYQAGQGFHWREPIHHLLAWGLSLRLAQAHYPETVLVTDRPGRALLIDRLGLPFTHVSTDLDQLREADPCWWALGKLVAYSLQDRPFVHIDTDVFLWQPLPDRLTSAPVLAQHRETYRVADEQYGVRVVEGAFARAGLSLPAEWGWSRSCDARRFHAANCGILGGTNVSFIQCYARLALDLVLNPRHAAVWAAVPDRASLNVTVEQFLLPACLEFHRFDPGSPHRGVYLRYLFPSTGAAFDLAQAARLGFTHLLADAKQNAQVTARLEQRLRREDPAFYRRCERVAGSASGGLP